MKVIPLQADSGELAYVEVSDNIEVVNSPLGGGTLAWDSGQTATALATKMSEVSNTIADVCRSVFATVRERVEDATPSELTLEFGIVLAGEAGIPTVAKGSVESTIKVTAKWNFDATVPKQGA
jgi:lipoate-protein ligase A